MAAYIEKFLAAPQGREALEQRGSDLSTQYKAAKPFPHISMDHFFSPDLLKAIVQEIRSNSETLDFQKDFYGSKKKQGINRFEKFGPNTRDFICFLNSDIFIRFLENLTGIAHLIPDPHLEGGGVHETVTGGFLKMHTDFNWSEKLSLHRRVNLLVYLNENWQEKWGGELLLSEPDLKVQQKISPILNRAVVFSTTDRSFHGHPEPLACPTDTSRISIALYYYSAERPAKETFRGLNSATQYKERPGENFELSKSKVFLQKVYERLPEPVKRLYRRLKKLR